MIATEIFNILLLIAIILIFARILGYIFYRLKQPAVIGEIIAGIIIGAVVLLFFSGQEFYLFNYQIPIPELNFNNQPFYVMAEIGILFLLFISGLEVRISQLKKTEKSSSFVAIGGVLVPLILGTLACLYILNFELIDSLIVGVILTATSVGVTVRTLMDLHALDTDVGSITLGGAVIDDVIGIILLALLLGIEKSFVDVVWVGIKIVIFFLIFLLLGIKIIDKVLDFGEKIHLPKALISISLAILLIYAYFANSAGISGIIGAFVAGLLIGQNVMSRKIIDDVKTIGYGFFIPLFFAWIGFSLWNGPVFDKLSWISIFLMTIVIITVAIIGKIIGCGIGAKLSGLTNRESLQIGVGMIPRMELALIIVTAAISRNLLTESIEYQLLTVTILLTVITTLIAPILIKASFKH